MALIHISVVLFSVSEVKLQMGVPHQRFNFFCIPENHEVWSQCLPADHPSKEHDDCKGQDDLQSMNVKQFPGNARTALHIIKRTWKGK